MRNEDFSFAIVWDAESEHVWVRYRGREAEFSTRQLYHLSSQPGKQRDLIRDRLTDQLRLSRGYVPEPVINAVCTFGGL